MAVNINVPSQVKTYANLSAFPATGALKTIYIAEDTNKTYRWTGSVYTEISASAAMTWGAIGGTLSAQTDLQNALNAKQNTLSLTTTGDNGASTLVGSTLNVPNYTLSGLGGVPTSRTLTINGVTQDLSANRTFTISTGITIGTTAIASGVVGRVLFEGAGNVVQESSSLFWDNTGFLAIGTNTPVAPSGYNGITINSASAGSYIWFQTGGVTKYTIGSESNVNYHNLIAGTSFLIRSGSSSYFNVVQSTGNIQIGTTTDAGFRLDVNGTARVSGNFTVTTSVTANTASSGTGFEGFKIQDGGTTRFVAERLITNFLGIGHNSVSGRWDDVLLGAAQRLYFYTGASERMRIFSTGNIGINTTTDAGFRLDVNGTARVSGTGNVLTINDSSNSRNFTFNPSYATSVYGGFINHSLGHITLGASLGTDNGSSIGIFLGGPSGNRNASALLQIDSTSRGFLPPRMTTTQKNAIASPAAGLMVYDTTLNVISYYNGSMWI